MKYKFFISFKLLVLWSLHTYGQSEPLDDLAGTWAYEVKDTPYGDYYGDLVLEKDDNTYKGKIVNDEGTTYQIDIIKVKGNKMVFTSDIEGTDSMFSANFQGDSLNAVIEVKGDDFLYKLKGKRKSE